ncbi:phosphate regulon transcriptional regulator PhoB [Varunaivibrio sulfuroxidans]|uniref:Phosphate regulon transcriptional regulatory protein PhoB n=1 Tax=Varunaivibrio sulfuroxidans TaxID=1773489 RepID=A0A4R3JDB6_9PROT|nr:phosphate regulon transcriptional regulator PhoB [Varunaivibrio sulfuroxidans]TCS63395.1 two-component system phosphate regulon response regulator PhoB [Varunaivibrio sulfuroxidans]WES30458.1 phosphate regulon transcriptional regulator PhoB [Varunaivibrio sulfuroxidans]
MTPLILIAEDEPAQVEVLRYNLESEGYRVVTAVNGEEALLVVEEEGPDLVLLDWMMPELSGIEVCRRLRERTQTKRLPVIMLTARGEESDRVRGLDSGADDYLVKPFSPGELIARVRAVMRRTRPGLDEEHISYGGITMDLAAHKVTRDGRAVHLGPTEFRLLRILMERPGRVFSRESLLDMAWGRDIYVEARTVDVHIRRLRKALNENDDTDIIRTVRGAGYAIDSEHGAG